jgi:DNA polymerase-3 subunit epsilon
MTTQLADLEILALDCQTTGSHSGKGQLLEMGWSRLRASDHPAKSISSITSHLIKLPSGGEIPPRICRITGICSEDLHAASSPESVWSMLDEVARKIKLGNQENVCPTVIHYSRFEEPFLKELHCKYGGSSAFALDIFCSHEIAIRLYPGLPRRGIRAIAGYFGHSVPELKRCEAHVAATAVIWRNLINRLENRYGIRTIDQLRDWLAQTGVPSRADRIYPMDPNIRLKLPDQPGVYRMLRSNGDLLYIGKARSLKQRVNSYYQRRIQHAEHILEMLSQAANLEVTLTGSAMEAAIVESDQIKKYSPPYNIALRKRDRNLWYCSRDFRQMAPIPDDIHRHGPLPSRKPLVSLSVMGELIESGEFDSVLTDNSATATLIGIPEEYAPSADVFRSGFQFFCQKHQQVLKNKPVWRALMTIGTQQWREALVAVETEVSDEIEADTEKTQTAINKDSEERDWTPESVSRALESVIKRCAYWIRRSRWFCLLSESTLAWEVHDGSGQIIIMVFNQGAIIDRQSAAARTTLPLSPGCKTQFRARQHNFDLITYDRLRVVTTELRRLISEDRWITLRPGPKSNLRPEELSRALRWV